MTAVNRATLYGYFTTGARPTQQQFADFIDSTLNIVEASGQAILSDVSAMGSFAVSGAFEARSGALFKSDVNVSGNLTVGGSFTPTNLSTTSALNVGGQTTLNGLTISGTTSAQAIKADGALTVVGQTTLASAATTVTPPVGDKSNAIPNTAWINPKSILGASGSRKNPDGSIEKWGTTAPILSVATAATIYASAFPNSCDCVILTARTAGSVGQSHDYVASAGLANFDSFNASNATATFFYHSWGK